MTKIDYWCVEVITVVNTIAEFLAFSANDATENMQFGDSDLITELVALALRAIVSSNLDSKNSNGYRSLCEVLSSVECFYKKNATLYINYELRHPLHIILAFNSHILPASLVRALARDLRLDLQSDYDAPLSAEAWEQLHKHMEEQCDDDDCRRLRAERKLRNSEQPVVPHIGDGRQDAGQPTHNTLSIQSETQGSLLDAQTNAYSCIRSTNPVVDNEAQAAPDSREHRAREIADVGVQDVSVVPLSIRRDGPDTNNSVQDSLGVEDRRVLEADYPQRSEDGQTMPRAENRPKTTSTDDGQKRLYTVTAKDGESTAKEDGQETSEARDSQTRPDVSSAQGLVAEGHEEIPTQAAVGTSNRQGPLDVRDPGDATNAGDDNGPPPNINDCSRISNEEGRYISDAPETRVGPHLTDHASGPAEESNTGDNPAMRDTAGVEGTDEGDFQGMQQRSSGQAG
jgi:hypothetical protein